MRRSLPARIVVSLLCLAWSLASAADVVVIVHPDNPLQSLSQREVSDLYLGRARSFQNGDDRTPLLARIYEQPAESPLRDAFFRSLNGMNIKQLNAYWARLRFSGEVLPPTVLPNSRSVVDTVRRDRNAIGYVHSSEIGDSVKIVLRLKE